MENKEILNLIDKKFDKLEKELVEIKDYINYAIIDAFKLFIDTTLKELSKE